jgi:hypothetical protein
MDLPYKKGIEVNHMLAEKDCKVYENFTVYYPLVEVDNEVENEIKVGEFGEMLVHAKEEELLEVALTKEETIQVTVNDTTITIHKKAMNILVDILDVYPFDLTVAKGSTVVIKRNGEAAGFTTPIEEFDRLELYWD